MDNKKMEYMGVATIFVVFVLAMFTTGVGAEEEYTFVTKWGSHGTGDGEFDKPLDITADSSGYLYVADKLNNRIQKFNYSGDFINKWGSEGTGEMEFDWPAGIAVDGTGNVFVANTENHRIQKFDADGNFITSWGSYGKGEGEFGRPHDIAVDSRGNVYVADSCNNRIQKFDSDGNFIIKWGTGGAGDGEFLGTFGVAVDGRGNVYVADSFNDRIQKFDSDGNFITKWGIEGTGDREFDWPAGIAVDGTGNVFVADTGNYRIQKFDSNGSFITKWGSEGTGDGEFDWPGGLAIDSSGYVYVADTDNNRIQKFEFYRAGGKGEIAAQITAGADDGFAARTPEYFSADSKALTIGTDLKFAAFLRFSDLKIPANATITKAYITVVPTATNQAGPMVHISAADVAADPSAPTTSSGFYARERTASFVNWDASSWDAGESEKSTDISNVIQELVESYDYSMGAPILIFLDIAEGDTENQYFAAFEDAEYEAPKLFIEYSTDESTGGGSDTTPPEITCPADVTVEQETQEGTVVPLDVTVSDICDPNPAITSNELDIYPPGTTTVTFTATDASGNSASCSVNVTVSDIPPFAITIISP